MADINTKTFAQLVQGQAAAVQARAAGLVDFSVGSILRAVAEATAAVGLWLQALILRVLALTRAATSTASDLDSFVADFGDARPGSPAAFARLPASYAAGAVTFSRLSTSGQAVVPFGAQVETADGSQKFLVANDATNPAYNSVLGGYVMNAGTGTVSVPVAARAPGAAGNVAAAAISVISSAVPGVDGVTNAAPLAGGMDAESDAALRIRFRAWILSLREGTPAAVKYAVMALRQGVTCTVVENAHPDGTPEKGFFYVVVDDGTGSPGSSLLTAAGVAVDAIRAVTSAFQVIGPNKITANVVMALTTASGADHTAVCATVAAALTAYLNSLGVGDFLPLSRLYQVTYDASPAVVEAAGLTVNSATVDIAATAKDVIRPGTVLVT